jgi:hypothetical protein
MANVHRHSATGAARISAAKKKAATSLRTPKAPWSSGERFPEIGYANALDPAYLFWLIPLISSTTFLSWDAAPSATARS